MTSFFQPNASTLIKPYAFMDLDDTLFQTMRKIKAWQLPTTTTSELQCATVNKQNQPLSFMSVRQAAFVNWLFASTELIAVTARDIDEIKRVKLPFNSWQVLTHGAVIMTPDGRQQASWQAHVASQLNPLQACLQNMIAIIEEYSRQHQQAFKLAIHHNGNATPKHLIIYLAIKHRQKNHQALADLAKNLPKLVGDEGVSDFNASFYIHSNANNLAILPHAIHKRHAVKFLLDNHLDPLRPSFGFGDSLADLPFLQLLDWYGTPNHGQVHDNISNLL